MLKKLGSPGIAALLVAVPVLAMLGLILSNTEVGMAKEIGIQEPDLSALDYSSVPQSVIDDAVTMATQMVGDSQEKLQLFVDQLLATYLEANDSDVVVFFNSGGWGWNMTEETPGWSSILDGIRLQLEKLGYRPLVLNYRRTGGGFTGCIREFVEGARRYPNKSRDLAERVAFLTDHIPDLRVIVAGESTGTVISDKTMVILKDRTEVFSIQTGTPFWHRPVVLERTLLMNSNGRGVDTFSYGNVPAMVWATVKGWLGMLGPEENPGNVLSWLRAPGHDYSWQYPGIHQAVTDFLDANFRGKD
ncbi:MAG TPA: hypothetical protein VJ377_08930 [Dehalococcoidales bacterium]|nr:hypothetical protein [Dehalococcoidales bacterium]